LCGHRCSPPPPSEHFYKGHWPHFPFCPFSLFFLLRPQLASSLPISVRRSGKDKWTAKRQKKSVKMGKLGKMPLGKRIS
jgi:hypothetical protein